MRPQVSVRCVELGKVVSPLGWTDVTDVEQEYEGALIDLLAFERYRGSHAEGDFATTQRGTQLILAAFRVQAFLA